MSWLLCSLAGAVLQAAKGFTINSIKTKLKRHGTVVARRGGNSSTNANGNPTYFDLNNLFEVEQYNGAVFQPAKYLSIASEDIDAAMGDGAVASDSRMRSVHVGTGTQLMVTRICRLHAGKTALSVPMCMT